MNNWIVKSAAVIAVAALAGASLAQTAGPRQGQRPGGGPGGPGGNRMMMGGRAMMEAQMKALDKVQATADQKAKVKALNEKNQKARADFMKKEFNITLPTPGAGRQGQGAGRAGQGGGRPGPGGPGGQNRPELTQEQRNKMRAFAQKQMESTQAEMKKILGSKYDAFETAFRAEMQSLMQNRRPGQGGQGGAPRRGGAGAPPAKP